MPPEIVTDPSQITISPIAIMSSSATINKISSKKFSILNGFPTSSNYVTSGSGVLFNLLNIENPSSSIITSSFEIDTFDD